MRYPFVCFFAICLFSNRLVMSDHSANLRKSSDQVLPKTNNHLEKVYQLIEKNQIQELKAYLEIEEVQNDPRIQTLIGDLYHDSKYERDYSKAALWWQKAAAQGNSKAQAQLANLHFQGKGVERVKNLECFG